MPHPRPPPSPLPRAVLRLAFVLPVAVSLAAGIAGGLVRAGVPLATDDSWIGPAVAGHAFLMICAFMGTVIGLERAVAVKHPLAFAGPLASVAAGVALLRGHAAFAAWLASAAALAFTAVNIAVVRRQTAPHTLLLLVAALAWATGCGLHAAGAPGDTSVPWWFCFLVLTIAAERLEMTRLMRRRSGAAPALWALFCALLAGAAGSAFSPRWGGVLYGLSLTGLAVWLGAFDIARRTVRAHGLSRYMALCLLLGYGWLGVAGTAWAATALGLPWRDTALHALALGFVFSMMLAHAPVILPAVARVKVLFGPAFYLPLALLQGSLLLRVAGARLDAHSLPHGAAGNALAVAAFIATLAGSAVAWRLTHGTTRRPPGQSRRPASTQFP